MVKIDDTKKGGEKKKTYLSRNWFSSHGSSIDRHGVTFDPFHIGWDDCATNKKYDVTNNKILGVDVDGFTVPSRRNFTVDSARQLVKTFLGMVLFTESQQGVDD